MRNLREILKLSRNVLSRRAFVRYLVLLLDAGLDVSFLRRIDSRVLRGSVVYEDQPERVPHETEAAEQVERQGPAAPQFQGAQPAAHR